MYIKKIFATLLAFALLVSTGCTKWENTPVIEPPPTSVASQEDATPMDAVRIPWDSEDSLNAYTCQSLQNFYIAGLLADPLVTLSPTYEIEYRLALEIISEPLRCSIKLRNDLSFPDGTGLKAEDVMHSIQQARSSILYGSVLGNISEVTTPDDYTVIITLAQPDIFFVNTLTFPIYPMGSELVSAPMGVGRFLFDQNTQTLSRNTKYTPMVKNIETIHLTDIPTIEEQSYALMEGRIDLMYSDMQSDLTTGMGTGYRQVPLSNMLYLSVNSASIGHDPIIRTALDDFAPRDTIARKTYHGFAASSNIPINPIGAKMTPSGKQKSIAPSLYLSTLAQNGWLPTQTGVLYKDQTVLALQFIVNEENTQHVSVANILADSYRAIGIELTIVPLPYEEYQNAVGRGEYDLYLGEVALSANHDIAPLIFSGSPLSPMTHYSQELVDIYNQVKMGSTDQIQLEKQLQLEKSVIPLIFKRGLLNFSRDFSSNIVATEQDIFYNIVDW